VQTLKVSRLRLITCLDQSVESRLDERVDSTARDSLFREEIGFSFFAESGFEDAGAGAANRFGISKGGLAGMTARILMNCNRARNPSTLDELQAHHGAQPFRRYHNYIDIVRRQDGAIKNREAMGEKERLVADARSALARYTIVASEPGEIVETLAKVGSGVAPGAPVVRLKSHLLRGAFHLDAADRTAFAGLDFCRVEVIGLAPRASNEPARRNGPPTTAADSSPLEGQVGPRLVDCDRLASSGGQDVQVALPGDVGLVSGQPLRLASRRYDAVFPVPATALLGDGDRHSVWVAGRDGTTEERAVAVADSGEEALISTGLRVGDRVILDPPGELQAGTQVAIAP